MRNVLKKITTVCGIALLASACAGFNDPYYPSSGYGSGYGNSYPPPYYGNNGYGTSYSDRRERDRLERERERLENERERLEDERERHNQPSYSPPPPRPAPEHCPSGFSPSEQKCSHEERRRGCQDMRLPGGLGCVRR